MPSEHFIKATQDAKKLSKVPEDKREDFYGLYKQATVGDNETPRPTSDFDRLGKAKWDAWTKYKGTSKDDAEGRYIELVLSIQEQIEMGNI